MDLIFAQLEGLAATTVFVVFCLIAAFVLYATHFYVVIILIGLSVLRHPRFCSKLPSVRLNFIRRFPATTDSMLRNGSDYLLPICEQLDAFVLPMKLFLSFLDENHALHVNSRFWLEETMYDEDASIETFIFRGKDRYLPIESPELLISSIFLNETYPCGGEMPGHTYKCPYPGARCCGSKETVKDVVTHLADVHEVRVNKESNFERVYVYSKPNEFDQGSWLLEVFSCHGRSFALQFQAMNIGVVPFYMLFLRILGERSEAEKFSCSLKIVGQGRKLEWVGKPRDLRESEEPIRDGLEGVVLPKSQAFLMCQANPIELRLRVEGKIERVQGGGLLSLLGF